MPAWAAGMAGRTSGEPVIHAVMHAAIRPDDKSQSTKYLSTMAGCEGMKATAKALMRIPNVLCGKVPFHPSFSKQFKDEDVDCEQLITAPTLEEIDTPWWDKIQKEMTTLKMKQYIMPAGQVYNMDDVLFVCLFALFGLLRAMQHWGAERCCRELSFCTIPKKSKGEETLPELENHWTDLCNDSLKKTCAHYDEYSNATTFYHSAKKRKQHRAESVRGNLHKVIDNGLIQWGKNR